ncbi:fibrobacter succinogenes major paralogous domain-containing protein [Fibrobacter intestinalis]|uniref:Major paralogous domain-containing protein n=1 Tax=Fibrobacter intestinalis TaxID=28122 RepID=A0A1T4NII7_9BACT|nr:MULTISPECIES: fibrobacter succinogenes major paralogous domain-containing protein [Fibrobacter]PBC72514.1 uncharacterized protein (TIGR02145 family) [Fibrobacter sp. NR9]SJZ79062.1 major paralogous domain-containing protein [Fibrobacter intestinalis]
MNIRKSIFAFTILSALFLAACGDDSGSSASGNAIPEADPNATLVSQVPVGDVYSDLTVRDANGNVVGVFDPNTGYITLSDGRVVTMDGNSVFESSSSSSLEKVNWQYLNPNIAYGTFTDSRDGQVYKTVTIGTQTWMAENLNYAYLQPTSTEDSSSFCYRNEPDSCAKYGRLYTWAAAMDSAGVFSDGGKGCGYGIKCSATEPVRGVCPEGWHLPSDAEWKVLIETVGGEDVAGKKLKSTGGWVDYEGESGNGTDEYGFSVLPAGFRLGDDYYRNAGKIAHFWRSTEGRSGDGAYSWYFFYEDEHVHSYYNYKDLGCSVRCLKD